MWLESLCKILVWGNKYVCVCFAVSNIETLFCDTAYILHLISAHVVWNISDMYLVSLSCQWWKWVRVGRGGKSVRKRVLVSWVFHYIKVISHDIYLPPEIFCQIFKFRVFIAHLDYNLYRQHFSESFCCKTVHSETLTDHERIFWIPMIKILSQKKKKKTNKMLSLQFRSAPQVFCFFFSW